MLYDTPGEKFLDDPEYVADVVAAASELPCPSCLTGLMQAIDPPTWMDSFCMEDQNAHSWKSKVDGYYDAFKCQSCKRRVLVERRAS